MVILTRFVGAPALRTQQNGMTATLVSVKVVDVNGVVFWKTSENAKSTVWLIRFVCAMSPVKSFVKNEMLSLLTRLCVPCAEPFQLKKMVTCWPPKIGIVPVKVTRLAPELLAVAPPGF